LNPNSTVEISQGRSRLCPWLALELSSAEFGLNEKALALAHLFGYSLKKNFAN